MERSHHQNKLLAYASLQAVLTHMDPNLRIHLSICCRSLKFAEKAVPLKCHTLELNSLGHATGINNVMYGVGVFLKYKPGKAIPDLVKVLHYRGGLNCDIDENGRRDWSGEKLVKPGDIAIANLSGRVFVDEPSEGFRPYLIFGSNKYRKQEILEYNQGDHLKASNYLNHFLFGRRSCPIQVKMLKLRGTVLRLPEGVKFQIRELDASMNFSKYIESLNPLLKPTKYPLDHVVVYDLDETPGSVLHPVIKNAHSVHFEEANEFNDFYQVLVSLNNKKITSDRRILGAECTNLIEKWRKEKREIGTSITFQGLRAVRVETIFGIIMDKYQYQENEDGHLFIPLYDSSDVQISAGDDLSESAQGMMVFLEDDEEPDFNYFKLEVVTRANGME